MHRIIICTGSHYMLTNYNFLLSGSMDSISMQFEVPAENKSSNMSLFNCVYYDTGEDTAS